MTKSELVRELAEDFELPRKRASEMVEAILDKITEVLKTGGKVQLTPFGQFKIRDRAARMARNPQTGEPVKVPAKRVLKFIAGRTLKDAVGTAKRGASKKTAAEAAPARKAAASRKPAANAKTGAVRKSSAASKSAAAKSSAKAKR